MPACCAKEIAQYDPNIKKKYMLFFNAKLNPFFQQTESSKNMVVHIKTKKKYLRTFKIINLFKNETRKRFKLRVAK